MGKIADFIDELVGIRKTAVMILLIAISVVFRITNFIDSAGFVVLLQNTVVAFFASNSIERVGETIKHYVSNKDDPKL